MLTNINYRGRVLENVDHLPFRQQPPRMYVHNCAKSNGGVGGGDENFKLVIFPSGKCRIMGCKKPLHNFDSLPFRVQITNIMSASITFSMPTLLRLQKLGDYCYANEIRYVYEPEIFPALRLSVFNPLCVNVFGSGKVVILGIRSYLTLNKIVSKVKNLINTSGALDTIDELVSAMSRKSSSSTFDKMVLQPLSAIKNRRAGYRRLESPPPPSPPQQQQPKPASPPPPKSNRKMPSLRKDIKKKKKHATLVTVEYPRLSSSSSSMHPPNEWFVLRK